MKTVKLMMPLLPGRPGAWCGLVLGSLLMLARPAAAQISVAVEFDQDQFLQGETLPVAVKVTNRSGQTLTLGADPDWLTFAMEARDGMVVPKVDEARVLGEFTLESSKVATRRVDLGPYFTIGNSGSYSVIATVRVKAWGQDFTSPPKAFTVIDGPRLWQQEFGVPTAPGSTNAAPEVRRYILQQANYIKGQLRLYLRITDGSGTKSIKVIRVGPLVSFSRPETQVDQDSNLHLIYQYGPRTFSYTCYNPDGVLLKKDIYDYENTRPRFQADGDGNVVVVGGTRREEEKSTSTPPVIRPIKAPPMPEPLPDTVPTNKPSK